MLKKWLSLLLSLALLCGGGSSLAEGPLPDDPFVEYWKYLYTFSIRDCLKQRFTYAPDLAQKTKEIIDSKKPFGIYHVVNSDSCTWYEAVLELYRQAKVKAEVVPVGSEEFTRPAKRPFYSVLLNTKLNPMRSYKEALKEYLKK